MRQFEELHERNVRESFKSTLLLLLFGLGALSFLIAADHPEWFRLHSASTVSAAMSNAARDNQDRKAPAKIDSENQRNAHAGERERAS